MQEKSKCDSISSLSHLDRVHVPVFVVHRGDDPVADIGQSTRLLSELEKNHVPHETLIVGFEGHGMHHADNQLAPYIRIEAFFEKNLTP